jgi:hypothetical protein
MPAYPDLRRRFSGAAGEFSQSFDLTSRRRDLGFITEAACEALMTLAAAAPGHEKPSSPTVFSHDLFMRRGFSGNEGLHVSGPR